jgi:2-amino-4-hydroxy-6-hydroxymethyldihydropteridine diphosphokinase
MFRKPIRVFVGLGSNVGNRARQLELALRELARLPSTRLVRNSSFYETSSVGPRQRDFLNAVVELKTTLLPEVLLQQLKELETCLGRQRRERWAPREIDLDLLFYGSHHGKTKTLTVPHPRVAERKFTLWPLAEIAPRFRHPTLGRTMARLCRELTDSRQRIKLFPWI